VENRPHSDTLLCVVLLCCCVAWVLCCVVWSYSNARNTSGRTSSIGDIARNFPAGTTVVWFDELLQAPDDTSTLHTLSGAGVGEPKSFWLDRPVDGSEHGGDTSSPADNETGIYTLMYTSGTTGSPKGVVVDKKRWKLDAQSGNFLGQDPPITVLSYLALAHGGDRGLVWQAVFQGNRIAFSTADTHDALMHDIATVKPTVFLGMSHFWARCFADYKLMLDTRVFESLWSAGIFGTVLQQITADQALLALCDSDNKDKMLRAISNHPLWQEIVQHYSQVLGIAEDLMDYVREFWFGGKISTQVCVIHLLGCLVQPLWV
jgi:acyl-CoA synthetase (AMP-forming)/AMP-acid ligase II